MFESLFQTFSDEADASQGAARIKALRAELKRRKLDGFIVPRADEHQNEYVPPNAERLQWLTGFAGSAGTAVVLMKTAAIFVDGRYTLQVKDQVDTAVVTPVALADTTPTAWLESKLKKGMRFGFDPWLTTPASAKALGEAAAKAGAELVPADGNPVDAIWRDRPAPPMGAIRVHPKKYAGEDVAKKLARLREALGEAQALVISNPQNIAWAFNIRGSDVAHSPLPLAFAIVPRKGRAQLFVEAGKLNDIVRKALKPVADVAAPSRLTAAVAQLAKGKGAVLFDRASAPTALVDLVGKAGGRVMLEADPIDMMKACKNAAELAGARAAHLRDGAAMARFLCWFDAAAAGGKLTEIGAVEALESFRRETGKLVDVSFPTISGAGPNGAIVHYRVTEKTNRKIGRGLFLLDSGAQYEDGTTDITRTIAVGKPAAEMRDRFTRVLKGHIAVARAIFPKGTTGAQLDPFARQALWEAGLDYEHGTGHGVGSFLSVHEGPQNISKRPSVALRPGMILSNEPGYYKTGAWGIRIENLIVVQEEAVTGAEKDCLSFETLTLAPIDLRLVETKIMTREELRWLDKYHARVRKELSPLVGAQTRKWLAQATRALARN